MRPALMSMASRTLAFIAFQKNGLNTRSVGKERKSKVQMETSSTTNQTAGAVTAMDGFPSALGSAPKTSAASLSAWFAKERVPSK